MGSLNTGFKIVLLALVVAVTGCGSSGGSSGSLEDNSSQHVSNDQDLSLLDHLRRINSGKWGRR